MAEQLNELPDFPVKKAMKKQRHGCLAAWLILMIIVDSLTAQFYLFELFDSGAIRREVPSARGWFPILAFLAILNVFFAIRLLSWKKQAFFGFVGTSIGAFIVNLAIGLDITVAALGLAGVAILYGVLHIGKENKGWPQLE